MIAGYQIWCDADEHIYSPAAGTEKVVHSSLGRKESCADEFLRVSKRFSIRILLLMGLDFKIFL